MGVRTSLQLLRAFRFNSNVIHGRSFLSSSSILHRKTSKCTHSIGQQTFLLSTIVDTSEIECDKFVDGGIKCDRLVDDEIECDKLVDDGIECDKLVDDGADKEKYSALHVAVTQLASEFGKESMLSLSNFFVPRCASVISTGSLKLDLALEIGGLPKGRIVEIYGKEASGKTTLALHVIKEAQKLGGYCAYLDAENALDPKLAEAMGINTKNLLVSWPDSAENMLSVVDKLTRSGSLDVIVVDSVAALVPQSELDGDIGTGEPGVLSTIMTKALRRIHYSLCRSKTLIIFLNQVRYSPTSSQGLGKRGETTSGGNALGFYAAVRLRISRIGLLETDDEATGLKICVQVMKNKLAPGMNSAELGIDFGKGLHFEPEVLELALEHGLVLKEGNSYYIEGEIFNSEQSAKRYLEENEAVFGNLLKELRHRLFDRLPRKNRD
ncbi:DNA repair protein recA homolog 2, mitochondrial isoform X1 [Amaranthus tricolor]|uniref:DNA repair protein recA homolog 2, mitochondrial isoform X1 n=1 Tax=Amaranthus tricolor TaxID=29722 RepID=UPI00258F0722|nr:DNA repair protein recA homolog 2, mitochondrial isoform X1 [Amaranthus tricolor]